MRAAYEHVIGRELVSVATTAALLVREAPANIRGYLYRAYHHLLMESSSGSSGWRVSVLSDGWSSRARVSFDLNDVRQLTTNRSQLVYVVERCSGCCLCDSQCSHARSEAPMICTRIFSVSCSDSSVFEMQDGGDNVVFR